MKRLLIFLVVCCSTISILTAQTGTGWTSIRAKQNVRDSVYFYKDANFNGAARFKQDSVKIGLVTITANGAELNILDGALVDATELNYLVGATSAIQAQIDSKFAITDTAILKSDVVRKTDNISSEKIEWENTAELSDFAVMLEDTMLFKTFEFGSGLIKDTAQFYNGAIKSFYNPKDTLVVTSLLGVMAEGAGTESVGVQVSWHGTLKSGSATNLNASAYTVTSMTTGNEDIAFANAKIPPANFVWATLSGITSGNKPSYLAVNLSGYKVRGVASTSSSTLLDGLMGYWDLDESSGILEDIHSTNDGTGTNITYSETGVNTNAIAFNGTSSEIAFGSGLQPTTGLTVSCWVKSAATSGAFIDQTAYSGGWQGFRVERYASGITFILGDGTEAYMDKSAAGTIDNTSFHHIVCTFDGTTAYIYIDNVKSVGTTWSNTIVYNAADDMYAGSLGGSGFTAMTLDEVAVYNRALTDAEVEELYSHPVYPF